MIACKQYEPSVTSFSDNNRSRQEFKCQCNDGVTRCIGVGINEHAVTEVVADSVQRGQSFATPPSYEKNDLPWLENNIEHTRFLINTEQSSQANKMLQELRRACELLDCTDDLTKGAYALQIYALQLLLLVSKNSNCYER
jgi:hypothetical protein